MNLDDGERAGPVPDTAEVWRSGVHRGWALDGRGGDDAGEIDLTPDGPPGPQAAWLIAHAVSGRAVHADVLRRLVRRPYPLRPRDGDGMRVDAVRGAAAHLLATAGERVEVPPASPALRACVAPVDEADRALADWFQWVLQPRPRWSHGDQAYEVREAERWLMLVGLVRSRDAEAFTWYRSGIVLLDAARGLDGHLDDRWRGTWARLLDVRPGPRDWRDWHEALLDALRA